MTTIKKLLALSLLVLCFSIPVMAGDSSNPAVCVAGAPGCPPVEEPPPGLNVVGGTTSGDETSADGTTSEMIALLVNLLSGIL